MKSVNVQLLAKNAIDVVVKAILKNWADLARDLANQSQDMTQESWARPVANAHISANFIKYNDECHGDMNDLEEKVQSLFYN